MKKLLASTLGAGMAVAAFASPTLQPEKIHFLGEGSNSVFVMVSTGHGLERLDNLVWGYRYSGASMPKADDVLRALAAADPRMTLADDGSISVDLNADGTITDVDFTATAPRANMTVIGSMAGYIFDASGAEEVALPENYLFYMPDPAKEGVFMPEEYEVALTDNLKPLVGTLVQLGEGTTLGTAFTSYRTAAPEATTPTDATVFSAFSRVSGTWNGTLTFKGTTGSTYVKVRMQFIDAEGTRSYVFSNPCRVTALAPEIPVTSITLSESEIDAKLSHKVPFDIVIEPADATYTGLTCKSSDNTIASVVATTGVTTTLKKEGSTEITVAYTYNPEISATVKVNAALREPVESITFDGADSDGVITLTPKEMLGLFPIFTPADPDVQDVTMTLSGNGTGRENYIATMYQVNLWDQDNNRLRPYELSGHRAGECKLTVAATDGSGYQREFTVKVVEQDRTETFDYNTGTIMLNEEWFGHTNGGLNWIDPAGAMHYQVYERENQGMSFGATSQYGAIYGGKLIVCSKQAVDGGDPLPGGGRVVVADAATLKRLGSVDDLMVGDDIRSMDGRACVGAGPGKAYIGSNAGIYILDLDEVKIIGKVAAETDDDSGSSSLYDGQIGDMVLAGDRVYALRQSTGVIVIDIKSDKVVKTIDEPTVQGICQTSDGNVWYAATIDGHSEFVCLNPATAEELSRTAMPAEIGAVTCGWGAWRTTQFTASKKRPEIWFCPGASISNGGSGIVYRWEIGSDPAELKPVFNVTELDGITPGRKQAAYGTIRYDDRTDEVLVMSCENGSSGHYRYHWTHVLDATTGEINNSIELRPYYWFQAHAIFPDAERAGFAAEGVSVSLAAEKAEFDVKALASDPDNINYNIAIFPTETSGENEFFSYSLSDDLKLTVTPRKPGSAVIPFSMESNGLTSEASLKVTVDPVKVESIAIAPASIEAVEGTQVQLTATVAPENATDATVIWTSTDESVATVSAEGLVTVIKEGQCKIIASAADGSEVTAECEVSALSGIDSILSDGERTDVYSVSGIMLKANASAREIKALPTGIYVTKGLKFSVK